MQIEEEYAIKISRTLSLKQWSESEYNKLSGIERRVGGMDYLHAFIYIC